MYIYRIKIKNFRNIRDVDWKPNKDLNIILGSNGSGKSNIALALDLLLNGNMNEDTFDIFDFYECDINNKIQIECWIDDVTSLEAQLSTYIQHIDENDNIVDDDIDKCVKTILIFRLESDGYIKRWSVVQSTEINELKSSLRKSINYTYISSDRKIEKDINLSKSSLFYRITRNNEELWSRLASIGSDIVRNANNEILKDDELKILIDNELKDDNSFFKDVLIGIKEVPSSYYQSGYQFMVGNKNYALPIDKYSTGQQYLFVFDLIIKSLNENSISYIEEIEQNLEPINQKKLAMRIRDKIHGQLFITSHSVSLLEYFDLTKMFLVNEGTIIKILDDIKTDEKLFEINVLKGNKRSFISSLMSKGVLLCEGATEYCSLPIYDEKSEKILLNKNIEIIKVDGKAKFQFYLGIYKKCSKETFVLIDNDKDVLKDIKGIAPLSNNVFIQTNDYESVVYKELQYCFEDLEKLIPFGQIKNFLESAVDGKNKKLKFSISSQDLNSINSYRDLYKYESDFKLMIHEKFVSPYFARSLAISIAKNNGSEQYKEMFNCIMGLKTLKKIDIYENVYYLGETC